MMNNYYNNGIITRVIARVIKRININFYIFIVLILLGIITHREWFFSLKPIASGDWMFHSRVSMLEWFPNPYLWKSFWNFGFYDVGGISFQGIQFIYGLMAHFGIDYPISERILFFYPLALLTPLGSFLLINDLIENKYGAFAGSLIYSYNTYILGIQTAHLHIGMAYSLFPIIFLTFIRASRSNSFGYLLMSTFLLTVSLTYEPRISYIIIGVIFVYSIYICLFNKRIYYIRNFFLMSIISFLLQMYWILPFSLTGGEEVARILPQDPWISWMHILNSMFLFHPFWTGSEPSVFNPQKIPFYYVILPILAFASLIFINKNNMTKNSNIIFFGFLAIAGIFLVKQENPPFGSIYTWLFHNLPGFNMFRDASKFYILIILSFSILIGSFLERIYCLSRSHKQLKLLFTSVFIIVLIFTIIVFKPAVTSELRNTFVTREIPNDYIDLQKFLIDDRNFSRTLWIPSTHTFGFYSSIHPRVGMMELSDSQRILSSEWFEIMGVKYIVLPYDETDEIYKHYMLSADQTSILGRWPPSLPYSTQRDYEITIDRISSLKKIEKFSNIIVYENDKYYPHIYTAFPDQLEEIKTMKILKYNSPKDLIFDYQEMNPTKYIVNINYTSKPFYLVFSEKFSSGWTLYPSDVNWLESLWAKPLSKDKHFIANNYANAWYIDPQEFAKGGNFSVIIYFNPQSYSYIGFIISTITFIGFVGYLFWNWRKRK